MVEQQNITYKYMVLVFHNNGKLLMMNNKDKKIKNILKNIVNIIILKQIII